MATISSAVRILSVISMIWVRVSGHGKLVDPPGRNTVMNNQDSKGYLKKCDTGATNWSDKANFCGGKMVRRSYLKSVDSKSCFKKKKMKNKKKKKKKRSVNFAS